MATTKDRWLADAIGTLRGYWRIGTTRLKDVSGVLQIRNSVDTLDVGLKASALQLSGLSPAAGDIAQFDAAGNISAVPPGAGTESILPSSFMIDALQQKLITGAGVGITANSAYHNNHVVFMNPAANGDSWSIDFVGASGVYNIRIVGITNVNSAKFDIFVDGVFIANVDWYSATLVNNVTASVFTSSLAAGKHTVTLTVNGRNASNTTGWFVPISYYLVRQ